jgi:small conductance mechanosensitive channel
MRSIHLGAPFVLQSGFLPGGEDFVVPGVRVIVSTVLVIGLELALLFGIAAAIRAVLARAVRRAEATGRESVAASARTFRARLRTVLLMTSTLLAVAILAYNGWLAARGVNPGRHTIGLLGSMRAEMWVALGIAAAKLAATSIAFVIAMRLVRRALGAVERAVNRWDQVRENDLSLDVLVGGLQRAIINTGWMLLAVFAGQLFAVPDAAVSALLTLVRVYLVIAIGLLAIRSTVVIVDTLDGWSRRFVQTHDWQRYYDHLRPLVPVFRTCLEYVLWILVAVIAMSQVRSVLEVAVWGGRLIQAIALFFVGRVVIELGRLEISRRVLPQEGLDEMARRRRATIAPLARSTFSYAVYFATAVAILASLGFNPMPFLAGAGILGLIIGFGAQSLINDVVSGFFVLFENTYLVGDAIEAAGAKGIVEAIEFRTTKIRDADGRLYIVRNGDVKQVVNYSKEYAVAVVAVEVAYGADLSRVFRILREAGERARAENPDVLEETTIDGVTAFGPQTMTVRTSTRVRPGRHEVAAAAIRLAIKEAFDQQADGESRKALVPETMVRAQAATAGQSR